MKSRFGFNDSFINSFHNAFNSLNHILLSESADANVQNRMHDFRNFF